MQSKPLTRSEFLKLSAGLVAMGTVPLVAACPAEEDGACDQDPDVTIGGNHGHELDVPLADVTAGERVTYDIQGSSPHTHAVALTADDFARLREGEQVVVSSTFEEGHDHQIIVRCG